MVGDFDNNQVQSNILHDTANGTVAPLGFENVAYHENNNMHRMNNHEWTDKQRQRIVKIDTEETTRGKHFMRKTSWTPDFQ